MLTPDILARARYLHERLRDLPEASATSEGLSSEAEADFLFWKQQFSSGNYDRFAERLRSLGISEQEARWLTQESRLSDQPIDRAWSEILERALDRPASRLEGADAFPFAELWLPLVSYARESVQPLAVETAVIAPSALNGLLLTLLQDLSEYAAFPAFQVFSESRSSGEELSEFILRVRGTGYQILFERFPILARQLSRLVTTWIEATNLFLRRFQNDITDIQKLVRSECRLLIETKSGISDRHDNGRQVILMTFEDGAKALYKPKSVSISEVLGSIEQWLTERGLRSGWRIAEVIAREGYGWEEFIEQNPCNTSEEVRSYYRSGGELLCLAYLLNAYDLWRDNLIAAGSRPVPIDTECFFHPGRAGTGDAGTPDRHGGTVGKASVIETGLLPLWQLSASHLPADFSGLGTGMVDLSALKVTEWENVTSNDIRPVTKPMPAKPPGNTVRWQGQAQEVRTYHTELIEGFQALYRTILNHKTDFVQFIGQFGDAETRFLYRPTQVYGLLLKGARSLQSLTSGIRQSAVFEPLYRVPLRENGLTPATKQLIDFEVESLLGLDIPRFHVSLDSRDLHSAGFCVTDQLRGKPLDTVKERISAMGTEDLNFQLEVIQESLNRFPAQIERPLDRQQAASITSKLAEEIRRRMNPASSPYLWEVPTFLPQDIGSAERQGVYLGDIGTLIFLAATEKLLGFKCFPDTSHFSDRLRQFILPDDYPIGICNGRGALIYGSLLLGSLTGNDAWKELALSLNAKDAGFSKISSLDITSGAAGFLLATTKLYQVTHDTQARTNAQATAAILAGRFDPNLGWQQPNGNSYLGFAHGLAGIVFALNQYGCATGDHQYQPLIEQALALESKQFADHSWPHALQGPRRTFKSWCHGTAGILMARAATGMLDRFATDELTQLLEKLGQRGQADHWCCGNFGIAEALSYIGQQANLPLAHNKSSVLLEETLERGLKGGFFRLQSSIGENFCFSPSLFRGTAGVGYSLLRWAHPGALPCILAFEV